MGGALEEEDGVVVALGDGAVEEETERVGSREPEDTAVPLALEEGAPVYVAETVTLPTEEPERHPLLLPQKEALGDGMVEKESERVESREPEECAVPLAQREGGIVNDAGTVALPVGEKLRVG